MGELKLTEVSGTAVRLFQNAQPEAALEWFQRAAKLAQKFADWQHLREAWDSIPETQRRSSMDWACAYARVLAACEEADALLVWTEITIPLFPNDSRVDLLLEKSYALLMLRRFSDVCAILEPLVGLQGNALVMQQKRLLWAKSQLHLDWSLELVQLRAVLFDWQNNQIPQGVHVTGWAIGLAFIDAGSCCYQELRDTDARACWRDALPLVQHDAYSAAWCHYNFGISYLRELQLENAEHHLRFAHQLVLDHKKIKSLQTLTLRGLAALYRVHGEWDLALQNYHDAFKKASDDADRGQALLGLGRNLRLSQRPLEAKQPLYQFLGLNIKNPSEAHLELAAVYLRLGDVIEAKRCLAQITMVFGADRDLLRILNAEIARLEGNPNEVQQQLEGLSMTSRLAREEATQFPELWLFCKLLFMPVPEILPLLGRTQVRVFACGVLRVLVNGRDISINPKAKHAQLLVRLLETPQRSESIERLIDTLYDDMPNKKNKDNLDKLMLELHDRLGYKGSVQKRKGQLLLDPNAIWWYDATEVRNRRRKANAFLEGVYSDWVQEIEHELLALEPYQSVLN